MKKRDFLPVAIAFLALTATAQDAARQSLPSFDEVDTDADGTVTNAEVDAALQGFDFATADLDGNQLLTRDEYDMGIQRQTGRSDATTP